MICYYTCKSCGTEIECRVTINEEDDLPEHCPECYAIVPDKAHEEVNQAALEKAIDSAIDFHE